jgi:hypothetical protein
MRYLREFRRAGKVIATDHFEGAPPHQVGDVPHIFAVAAYADMKKHNADVVRLLDYNTGWELWTGKREG